MRKELREKVYQKYNKKCAYCGLDIQYKEMQVDHIIPKYNFDKPHFKTDFNNPDDFRNLNPSCRSCNKFKDTYDLETFRLQIEAQIDRLRKYQSTFRLAERYGLIECKPKEVKFYFETL